MNKENKPVLRLGKYQEKVDARLRQLQEQGFAKRLWNREALWDTVIGGVAKEFMGWLDAPSKMIAALPEVEAFCRSVKQDGFTHAVLLGMGGSSLAPLIFEKHFPRAENALRLSVLDSTVPEMVKKIEEGSDISTTLFIVSSKSGSTAEVNAFYDYFFYRVSSVMKEKAGSHFAAITDEGSPLAELASQNNFRKIFLNFPGIGGRYSALSFFGIVPAALAGVNAGELLARAQEMAEACGPDVPAAENPGIMLGAAMAELALAGRDKLTYLVPGELETFGLWLEQLVAESTGKNGKGILPVKGLHDETDIFKNDRFIVQTDFLSDHADIEHAIDFPVINIRVNDKLDLGKEFFRWEVATATAGALLGINPFDQPNVQESKEFTGRLLKQVKQEGRLPEMIPVLTQGEINYFAPVQKAQNAKMLLKQFFSASKPGDYIAIQAYLPEEPETERLLSEIRLGMQKSLGLAATSQFGPRYLHSTGQYHKGGPATGFFIQFISSPESDIQLPGQSFTFGMLCRAQAIGDREALMTHRRRVMLIDLGKNPVAGLDGFRQVIRKMKPILRTVKKPVYSYRHSREEKRKATIQ